MTVLARLHADIDQRVRNIRVACPDWLCSKGCDSCCRQLSDVPQLTLSEWLLLREGLTNLPQQRLEEINGRMAGLSGCQSPPVTCPLLDLSTGNCSVYFQRPVACRTYGFYVQRDKGLYCKDIELRVADGMLHNVMWGNHDAIDYRIGRLGEIRALTEWFEEWIAVQLNFDM